MSYLGVGLALWPAFVEWRNSKMAGGDEDERVKMCKVKRNGGEVIEIHPREICRGDILVIENGDVIPADARILHGTDLTSIEMTLTGEPHDIKKKATEQFENKENRVERLERVELCYKTSIIPRALIVPRNFLTKGMNILKSKRQMG
jgi:P-type E1-E2 ATPase